MDWAIPIALRKRVRSCVKYPIANHLTHAQLSPQFKGFVANIDDTGIPMDIQSAMSNPKWKATVMEEMNALVGNNTWDVVKLPPNKKVVGCK